LKTELKSSIIFYTYVKSLTQNMETSLLWFVRLYHALWSCFLLLTSYVWKDVWIARLFK